MNRAIKALAQLMIKFTSYFQHFINQHQNRLIHRFEQCMSILLNSLTTINQIVFKNDMLYMKTKYMRTILQIEINFFNIKNQQTAIIDITFPTMSKRSSLYKDSGEDINVQLSTNKKQKKSNDSALSYRGTFGTLAGTERKAFVYDVDTKIYMDQATTPLKQELFTSKEFNVSQQISSTSKHRQILLKLDQAQQRLVVSDKKYGQLWRKYEVSCETIKQLNKEISTQRPFDMQAKFNLLQKEHQQSLSKIRKNQIEVQTLKSSLSNTNNKLRTAQGKLQDSEKIIQKLNLQVKDKQQALLKLEAEIVQSKEIQSRSFERIITSLKQQVQQLQKQLEAKSTQVSTLQRALLSGKLPQIQSSSFSKNLQAELGRLHKQKLNLVSNYEQKITSLMKKHESQLRQAQGSMKQQLQKVMGEMVENKLRNQECETEWRIQRTRMNQIIQTITDDNIEARRKINLLQQTSAQLQSQLNLLLAQSNTLHNEQQSHEDKQSQVKELFYELQSIKRQFSLLKHELDSREKQLGQSQTNNQQLMKEMKRLETQIIKRENNQLHKDKKYKDANQLLIQKLDLIETQRQEMERQLLTERLQSMKLREQLQEKESYLKRQYQLSLQNLKAELSQQIKSAKEQKNVEIIEKEKIYVQMRQLERKYQLLNSEMLTVDDMMSIATKVHKRHSHFVRK